MTDVLLIEKVMRPLATSCYSRLWRDDVVTSCQVMLHGSHFLL